MPATVPSSFPLGDMRAVLWGAWSVDRRASEGEVRFLRINFYRDGRFGTLAIDGHTTVYGSWVLDRDPTVRDRAAHGWLTLRFDHHAVPSAEYHLTVSSVPSGPIVLAETSGGRSRWILARAGAIDAALIGTWKAPEGNHSVDTLELRSTGVYLLRLPEGTVRHGRWTFTRTHHGSCAGPAGTLTLDPTDIASPLEHWTVTLNRAEPEFLRVQSPCAASSFVLVRPALDPVLRCLMARWRLVAPTGTGIPHEVFFRQDGTFDLLPRAGALRTHGQWSFQRSLVHPDALEGTLTLTLHPIGPPAIHERWQIYLPFHPHAELQSLIEIDGNHTAARFRRLFR